MAPHRTAALQPGEVDLRKVNAPVSGLLVALQYRLRKTATAALWVYLAAVLVFAFGHRCGGGHGPQSRPRHTHEPAVSRATAPEGTAHHCPACRWQSSTLGITPEPPVLFAGVECERVPLTVLTERPVAVPHLPPAARGPPLV